MSDFMTINDYLDLQLEVFKDQLEHFKQLYINQLKHKETDQLSVDDLEQLFYAYMSAGEENLPPEDGAEALPVAPEPAVQTSPQQDLKQHEREALERIRNRKQDQEDGPEELKDMLNLKF